MTSTTSHSKVIRKILFAIIWLVIWQVVSICVNNKILLAGPIEVFKSLMMLLGDSAFRLAVIASIGRICLGFLIGSLVGFVLAILSYRFTIIEEFFSPLVTVIKAVPVVSFIILVLIWSGPTVATVISSLVVFPIIFLNTLHGLKATDKKLLEMSLVYKSSFTDKLFYIYLPSIKPFLLSGVSLAAGMAWKSGIAAELIDQTTNSLGNGLYRSKINLLTSDLLAWTVATVLLAFVFEKLLLLLLSFIPGNSPGGKA
ncbi:MAG: ABC transporter permease subunit [Saccharofermentans sp.]|nr:ABC transporter permease subunit [Saccharofermentans sp.]